MLQKNWSTFEKPGDMSTTRMTIRTSRVFVYFSPSNNGLMGSNTMSFVCVTPFLHFVACTQQSVSTTQPPHLLNPVLGIGLKLFYSTFPTQSKSSVRSRKQRCCSKIARNSIIWTLQQNNLRIPPKEILPSKVMHKVSSQKLIPSGNSTMKEHSTAPDDMSFARIERVFCLGVPMKVW